MVAPEVASCEVPWDYDAKMPIFVSSQYDLCMAYLPTFGCF